jgi:tetrapyrrole methylase family protein/MazG family protein
MSDEAAREFERLLRTVKELRERCPWDREQKLADCPRHLIEEAYEAADAIGRGDGGDIADELGDVLAQVLFAAVIAEGDGRLEIDSLLHNAAQKLIRRHPHVYGDTQAGNVDEVLRNWEHIKQRERAAQGKGDDASRLAHAGRALPALMRAEKLGEKARRAGMDWQDIRGVLAKVREELDELARAPEHGDDAHAAADVGDLMLAMANAPRFIGRDAEQTLRRACDKFVARFAEVEKLAASRGVELQSLTPDEVEALWQEAKRRLID